MDLRRELGTPRTKGFKEYEDRQEKRPRSGYTRPFLRVRMKQNGNCRRSAIAELAVGHLLGHVQNQLAIPFFHLAQQAAKLVEKTCIFTDAAPGDVVRRFALGKVRQLRRFLTVIKELIEWALESTSEFFQRFDGRNSM